MSSQTLSVSIIADIRDIRAGLTEMNKRFTDFSKNAAKNIDHISNRINGLSGAIAKFGWLMSGIREIG